MATNPSLNQLKRAVEITERIESLQSELNQILGISGGAAKAETSPKATGRKRRGISAAGRAAIAAAQKARWAAMKAGKPDAKPAKKKKKRTMSPEAREKIAAAQRKRWAAAKSGK
jgi:hypothetical protein